MAVEEGNSVGFRNFGKGTLKGVDIAASDGVVKEFNLTHFVLNG
jgi:hypothetical protein